MLRRPTQRWPLTLKNNEALSSKPEQKIGLTIDIAHGFNYSRQTLLNEKKEAKKEGI